MLREEFFLVPNEDINRKTSLSRGARDFKAPLPAAGRELLAGILPIDVKQCRAPLKGS